MTVPHFSTRDDQGHTNLNQRRQKQSKSLHCCTGAVLACAHKHESIPQTTNHDDNDTETFQKQIVVSPSTPVSSDQNNEIDMVLPVIFQNYSQT